MIISNGITKSIIQLHVNGETHDTVIRSADTLLHTLREQLGLTGAKKACGNGDCGACTVLVNGESMHSCLSLAIEAVNQPITTIEGLLDSPIQKAFIENWAIQCGYCTPGFIVNTHALITKHPNAGDEVIEEWLQSNLCRCTGYQEIMAAVRTVCNSSQLRTPPTNE
ncbi:(2Fe-2S)-binding protein [Sporosarcina limicola]|uniref:Aerobic-type carbon monoxide dehydrogenase small subunit (CoxS/CutS family) n=1 Tax=Sporosarcina limicola TaxID=34101 RepID=A0A927MRM3_9BACL|nr:(2Fe-2S)-binding protein [Sporosarcina limicola]MBE1556106.1 aerobic-type carbon monoxide dehydrogenase small subunit (CoxS/CutS family) [Sporosarcina limicola]